MKTTMIITAAAVLACPRIAPADIVIEEIAPSDAMAVVGADDVADLSRGLDAMGEIGQIIRARLGPGLTDLAAELGLEADEASLPAGGAGLVVVPVGPGMDTAMMMVADYGERAAEIVDRIREAAPDGTTVESAEIEGHPVFVMTRSPDAPTAGLPLAADTVFLTRHEDTVVVATDRDLMTVCLERLGGQLRATISHGPTFKRVAAQLDDPDVWALVRFDDVGRFMGPEGQQVAMMMPMISQLTGSVNAVGIGITMGEEGGDRLVEQTMVLDMPGGRSGLTALMDTAKPASLPSLPGATRLVGYTSINFEFDGVVDLVRPVMGFAMAMLGGGEGMPDRDELEQGLQFADMMLGGIGPEVHWMTAAGGDDPVLAIHCAQPGEFETFLDAMAPQMNADARTVAGRRLYVVDPTPMLGVAPVPLPAAAGDSLEPIGIAIGEEHLLVGAPDQLQPWLADGDAARSVDPAISAIVGDDPVVAWGFSDDVGSSVGMIGRIMEMVPGFGPDQAELDEAAAKIGQATGPSVWTVRLIEDGFLVRAVVLAEALPERP